MKIDRIANSKRNMVFGILNRLCLTILPFINRTILIYVLGVEYLGLSSLFTSVLNILNLAELGFGSAVVYSMYKPIAENNTKEINSLLYFYRKVYQIIGVGILLVGMLAVLFIDRLVAGDVPVDINIRIIFIIQLLNVAFSYFFLAYKSALLSAFQREDIVSKISTLVMCAQYGIQFIIVFISKNYYFYLIILPICTVAGNLIKANQVNKLFPQYKPSGTIESATKKNIVVKVKALLLHKIGGVVANSLDNIIISAYMGLVPIAIYNNYWYIYSSVCYFIAIFHNSVLAGLGNSIAMEDTATNYTKFKKLNFVNTWIVGWCSCCMMCLYQPFMEIWVGKDFMYGLDMVVLLVIYFYINMARRTVVTFKDAAGLWIEDRFKPITSAVVNVVLNVVLINAIGIKGVVISTIVSFIAVEIPWETVVLFNKYFKKSVKKYYLTQGFYMLVMCIVIAITYALVSLIPFSGFFGLVVKGVLCLIVPNILILTLFYKHVPDIMYYIKRK